MVERKQKHVALFLIPLTYGVCVQLSLQAEAAPAKPAAIVEDIQAAATKVEPLDFLFEGDTIKLAEGENLKLAYLRSCIVEQFKGGVITVGRDRSLQTGGKLEYREEVDCDGGGIVPTERQIQDVAGIVVRAPDTEKDEPLIIVFATKPLFAFAEPVTELVITRVDPSFQEEYRLPVTGDRVDLLNGQLGLVPGGLYRATTKKSSALFRISRRATTTASSVISRLVGL